MSTKTMSLMLAIVLISTSFASAVEWADKMFSVKKHDFGSVAVASKTEYRFEFKNIYKEDVHIASVRTSCGCTTPIIEKHSLKTGETGTILARFNTGSFKGKKGATLTVVIDRPYYAEVQLRVDGYIRRDIVFSPGDVQFGQVDAGVEAKKLIQVSYAGRDTWQILDIESADPGVSASFAETSRSGGRVGYDINLTLSGVAKPGVTRSHIVVITNDRAMPRVPVEVMYDVKSPIMVSPQIVSVGNLKPGEVTEQRLIVRSDKPFRLIDIEAEGFDIEYNRDAAAKKMHVLPLKITAGAKAGRMQQRLTVHTDLPGELTGSAMVAGVILGQ